MKFLNLSKKRKRINLERAIEENIKKILKEGKVKTKEEQILINTISQVGRFLRSRSDQPDIKEITSQIQNKQKEIGFFYPAIVTTILKWQEEGRLDILDKIEKLSEKNKP